MKPTQKIGLFVTLTLCAAFLLINFLKGNDFLQGSHTFYSEFEAVEGLTPASPVYIRGYKAGSLKGIEFDPGTGLFRLKISVKEEFRIPADSRTEIFSSDLLGGKAVRILYGQSPETAPDGSTLPGSIGSDLLTALGGSIGSLSGKLEELATSLQNTLQGIDELLNAENRQAVGSTLRELQASAASLSAIAGQLEEAAPEIRETAGHAASLSARLDSGAVRLGAVLSNAEQISDELAQAGLGETVLSIRSLLDRLQDPGGTTGRLMQTDSLHRAVLTLAGDLDSLVRKIEKNPKKYLKISVF